MTVARGPVVHLIDGHVLVFRADLRQLAYRGADRDRVEDRFAELDWGQITTRIPRWASA